LKEFLFLEAGWIDNLKIDNLKIDNHVNGHGQELELNR